MSKDVVVAVESKGLAILMTREVWDSARRARRLGLMIWVEAKEMMGGPVSAGELLRVGRERE